MPYCRCYWFNLVAFYCVISLRTVFDLEIRKCIYSSSHSRRQTYPKDHKDTGLRSLIIGVRGAANAIDRGWSPRNRPLFLWRVWSCKWFPWNLVSVYLSSSSGLLKSSLSLHLSDGKAQTHNLKSVINHQETVFWADFLRAVVLKYSDLKKKKGSWDRKFAL